MTLVSASLRKRLGSEAVVQQVRYRQRGWNSPGLDALRDAERALSEARERFAPERILLVGHSMGGRVVAQLSRQPDVRAVVALAPWWPQRDADLIPAGCRLLTVHGTADTWTDPASSAAQTRRAAERGVDAQWVGIEGAGHYMLRRIGEWHRLTADFLAPELVANPPDPRGC